MNKYNSIQLPTLCQSSDVKSDNLYCGKWGKILKSCHDLDLVQTMSIIKFIQDIFIYYNIFKFPVSRSIIFLVIMLTDTQTDNDEYSIVVGDKPQIHCKCFVRPFFYY